MFLSPSVMAIIFVTLCSIRSGTCTFLSDAIRREMSERIHALSANKPLHSDLFEPCQEELLAYLRKQQTFFIDSDHFLNASVTLIFESAKLEH